VTTLIDLPLIDLRGRDASSLTRAALAGVLPRAALDVDRAVDLVKPITEDVRVRGGAAVREYTSRFDGVDLARTRVSEAAIKHARDTLDPKVRDALEEAARRALVVHEAQLPDRKDSISAAFRTRRSSPLALSSASPRCTRSAAPRPWPCSPTVPTSAPRST
jgi:histidinol dehydrogenase